MFCVATSAVGGTINAYAILPNATTPVTTLQSNVTYSTPATSKVPANETQVGFVVGDVGGSTFLLQQFAGNAINKLTVTFETSVNGPDGLPNTGEKLTFRDPDFYLSGLPKECSHDTIAANPIKITCSFRQTKLPFTFPAFVVFFNAPVSVGSGPDTISTKLSLVYSEQTNGGDPSPTNSTQEAAQLELVTLGTSFPINIKSAVAKSGAKIFTGDGGVPKNEPDKQLTELAAVPNLPGLYTVAAINIGKAGPSPSPTFDDNACISGGNFATCPLYTTSIADPFSLQETRFLDPNNPLALTYRIDASNLKRSPQQLLNAVQVLYTGKKYSGTLEIGTWVDEPVNACTNNLPNTNGLPCIQGAPVCFKNLNSTPGKNSDLIGDCQWILINTGNGLTKFF